MNETLTLIIQVVVIPAIPILVGYLCKFINKVVEEKTVTIENKKAKEYISNASDAVTSAVMCITQTYVDSLKKSGEFNEVSQKEAFEKTKNVALKLITEESKEAVTRMYGDFNNWIDTKIEEQVKSTKTPVTKAVG